MKSISDYRWRLCPATLATMATISVGGGAAGRFRAGKESYIMTPLKAIKAYCLECCGSAADVKLCPVDKCALHPYRLGKSQNRRQREYTPEQKAELLNRLIGAKLKNAQ